MALNAKQRKFVNEYLVDLNATQAAIRAGYSPKTSKQIGSRLLTNVDVQEAVSTGQQKAEEKTGITVANVLAELAKLGFANMADYITPDGADRRIDLSALTRDQSAAIAEITSEVYMEGRGEDAEQVKRTKLKLYDKRAALVDIGKHLGMFDDRVRLMGADGGPLKIYTVDYGRFDPSAPVPAEAVPTAGAKGS